MAGHSTELAATKLIDHTYEQMDQQKTPGHIYIDLSKEFDTLNFDILLSKLRYYGLSEIPLKLIIYYVFLKIFLSILFWFYSNKHYFQITFLHSKKILRRLACICF